MFKGVDIMFLSAHLMFLVVVFMFSYMNTSYLFHNMIWNDILSYVVIKVELVCELP